MKQPTSKEDVVPPREGRSSQGCADFGIDPGSLTKLGGVILDSLPCAVFVLNSDTRCRYANPAARRLLGYGANEVTGRDLEELNGVLKASKLADGTLPVGEGVPFESRIRATDGRFVPVELTVQSFDDGGGRGEILVATPIRDLRTSHDTELAREMLFNQNLLQTADVIILVLDKEGRIVRFNRFMEDLSGYTLGEVVGKSWFETFIPERERPNMRPYFSVVLDRAETRGKVNPIVTRGGEERLIEWHNKVLDDASGNAVGMLCIGLDITKRRQVENWMKNLVETTQDAVISIDRKGDIVLFNPAAERIFGYAWEEIRGRNVKCLMPEPYATEHGGYIERYETTGERRAIGRVRTVEALRKDGTIFPIELSVTQIPLDEEVHYAAFIRDISEKKKLEALVVEKERLAVVGATAASFVHEIGNPLNAMSMTAQLLDKRLEKDRDLLDASVHRQVRNLREELRRLTELLQEFRSLARQEPYDLRPTSLVEMCRTVLALHEQAYREQRVAVVQRFPAGLPLVRADRDKLKQALINLCNNALEAMPNGGRLEVRAFARPGEVGLEIRDTGTGIKEGIDVFEPFMTTKPKGTGLGLMITRKIVAAHGGRITYQSEAGKGTVFRITLPESLASRDGE